MTLTYRLQSKQCRG